MRRAPPITSLPAYPVTGGIGLMAVAVTVMTTFSHRWSLAPFEVTPAAFHGEPWRLVISALPHLDIFHLVFNVYWLWAFGTLIEEVWGHVRTLGLVLLLAAGSAAAQFAFSRGGLGLSGAGYGLFGLLWVLAPRDRRFAEGMDARTAQLMVVWFFLCIGLTLANVWHIANVAHGVGALLGVLVGFAVSARDRGRRILAAAAVPAVIGASYAGATVLRAQVNLSHDDHASFEAGLEAIRAGRSDEAVAHYQEAVRMDANDGDAWHNLGVAYLRLGRTEEAEAAFAREQGLEKKVP